MNNYIEFKNKFEPLLSAKILKPGQFNRWPSFDFIVKELLIKEKPIHIIETGSLRADNNWLGYGHSSLIWDWIISKTGGEIHSVDIDYYAIKFGRERCSNVKFIHCDSVGYLRNADASKLDLLYLDSYDWSEELHLSSCLHHMTELGTIWDRLPSGCFVAVDDCHTEQKGKHVLVHSFFEKMLNLKPLVSCHVEVWRKP